MTSLTRSIFHIGTLVGYLGAVSDLRAPSSSSSPKEGLGPFGLLSPAAARVTVGTAVRAPRVRRRGAGAARRARRGASVRLIVRVGAVRSDVVRRDGPSTNEGRCG